MHELSQTVERDGQYFNVNGHTGADLEGPFTDLDTAVASAERRSASFNHPLSDESLAARYTTGTGAPAATPTLSAGLLSDDALTARYAEPPGLVSRAKDALLSAFGYGTQAVPPVSVPGAPGGPPLERPPPQDEDTLPVKAPAAQSPLAYAVTHPGEVAESASKAPLGFLPSVQQMTEAVQQVPVPWRQAEPEMVGETPGDIAAYEAQRAARQQAGGLYLSPAQMQAASTLANLGVLGTARTEFPTREAVPSPMAAAMPALRELVAAPEAVPSPEPVAPQPEAPQGPQTLTERATAQARAFPREPATVTTPSGATVSADFAHEMEVPGTAEPRPIPTRDDMTRVLETMRADIREGTAGSRAFLDQPEARVGYDPKILGLPSTFPAYMRDIASGSKLALKGIEDALAGKDTAPARRAMETASRLWETDYEHPLVGPLRSGFEGAPSTLEHDVPGSLVDPWETGLEAVQSAHQAGQSIGDYLASAQGQALPPLSQHMADFLARATDTVPPERLQAYLDAYTDAADGLGHGAAYTEATRAELLEGAIRYVEEQARESAEAARQPREVREVREGRPGVSSAESRPGEAALHEVSQGPDHPGVGGAERPEVPPLTEGGATGEAAAERPGAGAQGSEAPEREVQPVGESGDAGPLARLAARGSDRRGQGRGDVHAVGEAGQGAEGGGLLERVLTRGERLLDRANERLLGSSHPDIVARKILKGEPTGRLEAEAQRGELPGVGAAQPRPPESVLADEDTVLSPTGKAGNINLDRMGTPDEAKIEVARVAALYQHEMDTARRGVRPWSQAELDAAREPVESLIRGWQPGATFTDSQVLAIRDALAAASERFSTVREQYRTELRDLGVTSPETQQAFRDAAERMVMVQHASAGAAAEAGRSLGIHRKLSSAARNQAAEDAVARMRNLPGAKVNQLLDELANMPDDPLGTNRFMQWAALRRDFWQRLNAYRVNAMLSAPSTHIKIILSEAGMLGAKPLERLTTAGIDAIRARLTGTPQERFAGEARAGLAGMRRAQPDVSSAAFAKAQMPPGYTPDLAEPGYFGLRYAWMKAGEAFHRTQGAPDIENPLGGARRPAKWEIPIRAHQAEDAFFRTLGMGEEMFAVALRDAKRAGLSGDALAEHMSQAIANPSVEMLSAMDAAGKRTTFNTPLGPTGEALMNLRNQSLIGRLVVPFAFKAANLVKTGLEYTPLQAIPFRSGYGSTAAGKILAGELTGGAASEAAARAAMGTTLMAGVALAAHLGYITGAGPSDPKRAAELRQTGWQPYSAHVPGLGYWSYRWFEPWGLVMGLAADTAELMGRPEMDARRQSMGQAALRATVNNLTNQTFLRDLSDTMDLVMNKSTRVEDYVQSFTGSYIPNALTRLARGIDPTIRETHTANGSGWDELHDIFVKDPESRLPGLTHLLEPALTPLGQEETRGGTPLSRVLSPGPLSEERPESAVEAKLAELGVAPGRPSRRYPLKAGRMIDLPESEYRALLQEGGGLARERLETLFDSPRFQALEPDAQAAEAKKIINQARLEARRRRLPQIRATAGIP